MRRLAFTVFCTACALAIGIPATVGLSAVGAEEQPYRPLSKIPRVERFGQAALDSQAEFLGRMSGVEVRYGENGAVRWVRGHTGIVLPSGLAGFRVGQRSAELLDSIGPALLAAGTEELHVVAVADHAGIGDPVARAASPDRAVNLVQYIRGRPVQGSSVNILLNKQTNEIKGIDANFLPDRGLPHEPELTATEARTRIEKAVRESALTKERKIIFQDAPAQLAYAFEEIGADGGVGGALVWLFAVTRGDDTGQQTVVNASTGEVIRLHSFVTSASDTEPVIFD